MIFSKRNKMSFSKTDRFKMTTYKNEIVEEVEAPFSPLDITGLIGWWDASDASTVFESEGDTSDPAEDNDDIGYMLDKSGTGNHLSGTLNKPNWVSNQLNGKPVVLFGGGSNESLTKTSPVGMDGIAGYTIFMVMNRTFTSGNRDSFYLVGDSLGIRMRWVSVSSVVGWFTSTDAPDSTTSSRSWGDINTYYVRKATYDGSNQRFYFEGTNDTDALTGNVSAGGTVTFSLGDSTAAAAYIGGMAEVLFYDNYIGTTNEALVEAYLLAKWGI